MLPTRLQMLALTYKHTWIWSDQNRLFFAYSVSNIGFWQHRECDFGIVASSPSCMYQCICTHMLDVIAPAFFFDYCGANFNRWISWQTAEEELQYENPDRLKLREGLYLLFANRYKKISAPMRPKPSIWERIFTTTYTTIDTIGAPGDKMPRERERSFLP